MASSPLDEGGGPYFCQSKRQGALELLHEPPWYDQNVKPYVTSFAALRVESAAVVMDTRQVVVDGPLTAVV
jgi:hypothetical protein